MSTPTTDSTPPYPGGGTEIQGGASIATRSGASAGREGVAPAWRSGGRPEDERRDKRPEATTCTSAPHKPLRGCGRGQRGQKDRASAQSPTHTGAAADRFILPAAGDALAGARRPLDDRCADKPKGRLSYPREALAATLRCRGALHTLLGIERTAVRRSHWGRAQQSAPVGVLVDALAPQTNTVCLCSTPRPRQRRFRRLYGHRPAFWPQGQFN